MSHTTQHVTINELLVTLTVSKGAKIVTMLTQTQVKMNKKHRETGEPNPYNIYRIAQRRAILGANYENAVNKRREDEGGIPDFMVESLWKGKGERHGPYTVRHKTTGRIYFAFLPKQDQIENPSAGDTGSRAQIVADAWIDQNTGNILSPDDMTALAPFMPPISKAGKQDVECDILWRTIALDNVLELHYGGVRYVVQHKEYEKAA